MKHLKDINNFKKINETLDVYDFGRKRGNLHQYYWESCLLAKEFTQDDLNTLRTRLPDFDIKIQDQPGSTYGDYYLYLELNQWNGDYWILHYYGDYCYGIFRFEIEDDDSDGDLNWVEFCDEIDPLIKRLMRDKKRLVG